MGLTLFHTAMLFFKKIVSKRFAFENAWGFVVSLTLFPQIISGMSKDC